MAAVPAATVAAYASAAIAAASTAIAIANARKAAKAQEEAAEKRNDQLVKQTIANYDELADVELDAQLRATEDSMDVQKGFMQQRGRINVMAAAMGTSGMSVKSQLKDLEREKYSNYNTILQSRQAAQDNIRSQAESMRFQAASSMDVSPVSRPSWAAGALQIGAQAINAYSAGQEANAQNAQLQTTTQVKSGG